MTRGGDLQHVRTSEERYPTSELVKTEFYADFLRGVQAFHGVGGTVFRDGSLTANITVLRKRGEFGAHGRKGIAVIIPHLRRALRTYRRLSAAGLEQRAILTALDRLHCGVLLVDRDAHAIFVNAEARRIVAARDGLSLERDGVTTARIADTRALRALIARAAVPAGGGGALVLGRPSARRPLGVEVVPLVISENEQDSPPVVGMFVADPDRQHESDEALLARLYRLTPAEAGLAARLASGNSLQDAAEQRQISHETARTHLKRILHKTGTQRQAELLLHLRRGPLSIMAASRE